MKVDLSPAFLSARLAAGAVLAEPSADHLAPPRRAAVAALLSAAGNVLLMRRTERTLDRWSGQIALPGGGVEPADRDLVATAVRETREEVGRDLESSASLVGALPVRRAIARGRAQPLTVQPFVFVEMHSEPAVLGPEASDAFWFPLEQAARGALDSVHRYRRDDGLVRQLPCWRAVLPSLVHPGPATERCVWGMTYYMLRELLEVARAR